MNMNTSHSYHFLANQEIYADIQLEGLESERESVFLQLVI